MKSACGTGLYYAYIVFENKGLFSPKLMGSHHEARRSTCEHSGITRGLGSGVSGVVV